MKVISDEEFRNSILSVFPEFENSKFVFNRSGWTSVVVDIDNEYICKFPRTEQKKVFLETENLIIEKLSKAFLKIEFPHRKSVHSDLPFYIHKKLKGHFITVDDYAHMTSEEKFIFSDNIASFFARLHQLPVDDFQNILKIKNEQISDIDSLLSSLESDFSVTEMQKIFQIIQDFTNMDDKSPKIVGYYDFHAQNVLFNENKEISGIFDFDEVAIGTAKFDLRELFLNYNQKIGLQVLTAYNQKVAYPISPETIKISFVGWVLVEYVNMKKKIANGELKDVSRSDLTGFKTEVKKMIEAY